MKILMNLLVISILAFGSSVLAKNCYEFTTDEDSQLKSLKLTDPEKGDNLVWELAAEASDGKKFSGQVTCQKKEGSEWSCFRDDDGGSFRIAKLAGKLTFETSHFEFGTEEKDNLVLQSEDDEPWVFEGKSVDCPSSSK